MPHDRRTWQINSTWSSMLIASTSSTTARSTTPPAYADTSASGRLARSEREARPSGARIGPAPGGLGSVAEPSRPVRCHLRRPLGFDQGRGVAEEQAPELGRPAAGGGCLGAVVVRLAPFIPTRDKHRIGVCNCLA